MRVLLPTSVTADFDFPERGYAGRGSGANGPCTVSGRDAW